MQCTSCQFENMPGVAACGRCGARLGLAAAAIDVYPPRATAAVKRLRRWFPWYGWLVRVRDGWEALARNALPDLDLPQSTPGLFARMILPGWPQMFLGHTLRGKILLRTYLGLLLVGLVFVGTPLGSLLLGSALAIHAASVIDVIWAGTPELRARVSYALLCLTVLGVLVYFPLTWSATQIIAPRRLMLDAAPFAAGDVLLCLPSAYWWSEPAVGDVVLYRIPTQQVQTRTAQGGNAVYRVDGEFIDRVLAGPGQSVKWENGVLQVDGQPSPWLPLNPTGARVQLQLTVPSRHYFVLPSAQPQNAPSYPPEVWTRMSLVARESVLGRLLLRHQPLWRWWWVR